MNDEHLTTKLNTLDSQQDILINNSQSVPQDTLKYLRKLEGDCRIKDHQFLRINYLKVLFLAFPFALTFVGLVLLYQFEKIRLKLVFSKAEINPTHIIVTSSDEIIRICRITKKQWKNSIVNVFFFQELQYEIIDKAVAPLAMKISQEIKQFCMPNFLKSGLTMTEAEARLDFYGNNQHLVKIPSFFAHMFNFLFLSLFTYIQYFTFYIYFLENNYIYGYYVIGASVLGSLINYFLIRASYKKVKQIAQKNHQVQVIREGISIIVKSSELVPGDLYSPKDFIPCDSIILQQDLFVSEVSFTGQSIPIGKFSLKNLSRVYENQHWAYQGSEIISAKDNSLAVVVNTGYTTRKGRIIRKILNQRQQGMTDLFVNIIQICVIILFVTLCSYFTFYNYMFSTLQNKSISLITLGFFVVQSIPSIIPIFLNFAFAFLLVVYRKKQINCLRSEKTIESSRLQTICFDKTGTLTQNKVQIQQFLLFNDISKQFEATSSQNLPSLPLLHNLFATCHSVQQMKGRICGDEIDIKMFQASKAILNNKQISQNIIFQVQIQSTILQVHKVHQFQSEFQSMSVLVKNKNTGQHFIFAKGSPQKLHSYSQIKYPNFSNTVKQLSLEGYRSIAVSVRKLENQKQFNEMCKCSRELCLRGTVLIALITFTNKIKEDAPSIINILQQAGIVTKIVTGDNIFVAIQTALTLKMVPLGSRIIALEGDKLQADGSIKAICVKKVGDRILEDQVFLQNINSKQLQGDFLAMDLAFVKKAEDFFLRHDCTVFARATPQLKAMILKKEKQKIQNIYKSRSLSSRLFGGRIRKVAMVGDGANDLMAFRQANVGIGIIDSDAVYSADFTIKNLSQIDTIIRQSKAGEQKVIQTIYYEFYCHFANVIQQTLTIHDMALTSFLPSILKNFGLTYILTYLISFTPSANRLSKYCPSFNLIGKQFLLTWWGSMLILAGGYVTAYFYYINTNDFQPNPNRSIINGKNKSATIVFLFTLIESLFLFIAFSSSHPFKKPLYYNIPVACFLILGFIIATLLFFFTQKFESFLQIKAIGTYEALLVYVISLATGCLIITYTKIIRNCQLYQDQFPKQEQKVLKLKQLSHSIS